MAGDQGRGRVLSLRYEQAKQPNDTGGSPFSSLPSHSSLIGTPLPSHLQVPLLPPSHVGVLPATKCVYSNYAFRTGEITTGKVWEPTGRTVRWT